MSEFTEAQAACLEKVVSDIIESDYAKQFHDLKKKYVSLEAREQESRNKILRFQEELKKYEECHKCHTNPAQFVEAGVQCTFIETDGQIVQPKGYYILDSSSNIASNYVDAASSSISTLDNNGHSHLTNGVANTLWRKPSSQPPILLY